MENTEQTKNSTAFIKENGRKKTYTFEFPLKLDLLGKIIRALRRVQNLSQEKFGELIGVQKSQISKLETSDKNVTFGTLLKVFKALRAKVSFKIELQNKKELLSLKQALEIHDENKVMAK